MAAIRTYLVDGVDANGWQALSTSTQPAADSAAGWVVGTGATNHSELQANTIRASTTFTGTTVPDGSLDTSLKDAFRFPDALNGAFDSGNWSLQFTVRSLVQAGAADGRIRFRLIKADADGSNATEITSAQQQASLVSNVASGADSNSTLTFNPGAITMNNQYLFIQIAWERTGAGGMTTTNIRLRTGSASTPTGTSILTANFVNRIDMPVISNTQLFSVTVSQPQEVTGATIASTVFYPPTVGLQPNRLEYTEDFGASIWVGTSVSLGNDATTPPLSPVSAADAIIDGNTSVQGSLDSTLTTPILNDSADYIWSVYVKKLGSAPSVFPEFYGQMAGGTGVNRGVSFNAFTGAISKRNEDGSEFPYGVEDINSNWWRVWWKLTNNSTGNTVARMGIFPARSATLGGASEALLTGQITLWGANITRSSGLQTYQPNPILGGNVSTTRINPPSVGQLQNICPYTEEFDNSSWTKSDVSVTADTHSPPSFAPAGSSNADTVADSSGSAVGEIDGAFNTIVTGLESWVGSFYVRKDTDTTRFPTFGLQFQGGLGGGCEIRLNTQTGAVYVSAFSAPEAYGVENIDSNWWRIWFLLTNGTANDEARLTCIPSGYATIDASSFTNSLTGSVVLWGANLTRGSALGTYQRDPVQLPNISSTQVFAPSDVVAEGAGVTTGTIASTVVNAPEHVALAVTPGTVASTTINGPSVTVVATTGTISTTQLSPPTIAQTVENGTIASGNQLFAPTVAEEAQSVTTGHISTTQLFAPSTSITIVGETISGTQLFAPSLVPVATGGHISSTLVFAVSVALAVTTSTIASGSTTFAPSIAPNIDVPTIAGTTFGPPSVTHNVTLAAIPSGNSVFAPTVDLLIDTAFISNTQVFAPTTSQTITGAFISDTALFGPTVTAQGAVAGGHVSTTQIFGPTVHLNVTTGHVSTTALNPPSVVLIATGGTIASGNVLFPPEISQTETVTTGTISTTQLFSPSLSITATGGTIASGNVVFAPSIELVISSGTISTTNVFAPSISETPVITGSFISQTQIFAPIVVPDFNITTGHISSTQIFVPRVILGEIPKGGGQGIISVSLKNSGISGVTKSNSVGNTGMGQSKIEGVE